MRLGCTLTHAVPAACNPPRLAGPRTRQPKANKTDITPNYWLKETEDWVVFPHEVQGLTHDEISRKGPGFLELVKAPGGPHADE